MRGVLANAHFDVTDATNSDRTLAEAEQFIVRWRGHSRIVPALGPHAPYTVGPELYRRLHALAERLDILVVTHLAETQEEDRDIRRRYGRSPIRHLTWQTSVSWTAGWSPPTASGSTVRRSIS
jgi:5-methylthioadenosine/S-adenosylhomocysteine deaminase